MRIRLTPQDDLMHPVEAASNFNESRYYNFFDAACGLGGWLRMGNRPNEGHAELTACLYLPGGEVAFWFARPPITSNDAHHAAGMRFEVVQPYVKHRVSYEGPVLWLEHPNDMEDPATAFRSNPKLQCRLQLEVEALAKPWGGEPEAEEGEQLPELDPEKAFVRGHVEQLISSTGAVGVGERRFELDGAVGLRDHSWGPRYWQSVWWYRWLTANFGRDFGFAATVTGSEDGDRRVHGFVYDRGRYGDDRWVPVRSLELATDYDDGWYHRRVEAEVATDDHSYGVVGTVWSSIPLRNRRAGLLTRITEGMTTWRYGERTGSGLTEYLDQIVDGRPVGAGVAGA